MFGKLTEKVTRIDNWAICYYDFFLEVFKALSELTGKLSEF